MERTAECHCGQFRVIAEGEPERVYLCHCKACQRRTGTAFHFGVGYQRSQVRFEGEHKIYRRGADSGSTISFYFCPNCGSNLYWHSERNPQGCGVAGGAFPPGSLPPPTGAVFEEDMHPWLALPSITEHHQKGRPPAAS